MNRSFPADVVVLRDIREFIRECAVRDSFGTEADDLMLAVSEACSNALVHSDCTSIDVTWTATPDRVEIEVRDDGIFRRKVPAPEIDGKGHRGIPLMMALTDQVSISGGTETRPGTLVRLVKYRTA